jgi:hypothetical protein
MPSFNKYFYFFVSTLANIRLSQKNFSVSNTLAYLAKVPTIEAKKVLNIDARPFGVTDVTVNTVITFVTSVIFVTLVTFVTVGKAGFGSDHSTTSGPEIDPVSGRCRFRERVEPPFRSDH